MGVLFVRMGSVQKRDETLHRGIVREFEQLHHLVYTHAEREGGGDLPELLPSRGAEKVPSGETDFYQGFCPFWEQRRVKFLRECCPYTRVKAAERANSVELTAYLNCNLTRTRKTPSQKHCEV